MKKVKDKSKYNRMQQGMDALLREMAQEPRIVLGEIALIFISSIIFSSFFTQWWKMVVNRTQRKIYVSHFFYDCFASGIWGLIVFVFIAITMSKLIFWAARFLKSDSYEDYDTGLLLSKKGELGSSHTQTEEERQKNFLLTTNVDEITEDILGKDKYGRFYSPIYSPSMYKNKLVLGATRAGKSDSIVINDLLQCIKRGESMVVTDSKGDLYRWTSSIARKHGYNVKVMNFKPGELKHSDGWNPLRYITEEDEIQAEVLARTIIENTGGVKDFWPMNELNCLKACMLHVATTPEYEGRRTMAEVCAMYNNPSTFDSHFLGLPYSHPARKAFEIYNGAKPDVKAQILNGLGIRLTQLSDKYAVQIMSNDEVDLTAPMKEKCLYYVVMADTNKTMSPISALFFTQMFEAQCSYHDKLKSEDKKKSIFVRYELDEMANIGLIPDFDKLISTFASRRIAATLIFQSIPQMMDMYPNQVHETIIENITIRILLKGGSTTTCETFSKWCGDATVMADTIRRSRHVTEAIDMHGTEYMTGGKQKRPLFPPDFLMNHMDKDDMLVHIVGEYPLMLKKYLSSKENKMYLTEAEESPATEHIPDWLQRMLDEKTALEAELAAKKEEALKMQREQQKKREEASRVDNNSSADAAQEIEEDDIPEIEPQNIPEIPEPVVIAPRHEEHKPTPAAETLQFVRVPGAISPKKEEKAPVTETSVQKPAPKPATEQPTKKPNFKGASIFEEF